MTKRNSLLNDLLLACVDCATLEEYLVVLKTIRDQFEQTRDSYISFDSMLKIERVIEVDVHSHIVDYWNDRIREVYAMINHCDFIMEYMVYEEEENWEAIINALEELRTEVMTPLKLK